MARVSSFIFPVLFRTFNLVGVWYDSTMRGTNIFPLELTSMFQFHQFEMKVYPWFKAFHYSPTNKLNILALTYGIFVYIWTWLFLLAAFKILCAKWKVLVHLSLANQSSCLVSTSSKTDSVICTMLITQMWSRINHFRDMFSTMIELFFPSSYACQCVFRWIMWSILAAKPCMPSIPSSNYLRLYPHSDRILLALC